jgi:hypothetical protein
MQRSGALEEEAFLYAEACELAVLSKEFVGCAEARRKPLSALHTLSVELAVLMGVDDSARMDRLIADATELLAREGRQDAIRALQATFSRLQDVRHGHALPYRGGGSTYFSDSRR